MTFDDALAPHQIDIKTFCGVCGCDNSGGNSHTFNVCNENLRTLLKHYYEHVIESEGSDGFLEWNSADGKHRNMTDDEIRFIRKL